jgi:hypothetical protein
MCRGKVSGRAPVHLLFSSEKQSSRFLEIFEFDHRRISLHGMLENGVRARLAVTEF